jgi:hypothetical protein
MFEFYSFITFFKNFCVARLRRILAKMPYCSRQSSNHAVNLRLSAQKQRRAGRINYENLYGGLSCGSRAYDGRRRIAG